MSEHYEALKTEIVHTSDRWQTLMNLSWYTIDHTFRESFNEEDPQIIAETEGHWEYREGRMRWYLARVSGLTPEELELTVVHEMVHLLTEPMEKHLTNAFTEHCEYAVTCISKALLAVRDSRMPPVIIGGGDASE